MTAGSRRGLFARYWLPVLLYIGMIFSLSSIHGSSVPTFFPGVDKLEHLLEYSLFGLLAGRAIRFTLGGTHRRLAAAFGTMALGALVGALDELYQLRVPGRSSDVRDWITDIGAVAVSVLVTQLVHTRPIVKPASRATSPAESSGASSPAESRAASPGTSHETTERTR